MGKLDKYKDKIINTYQNGNSLIKIAKIFNCSTVPVCSLLQQNNIQIRNHYDSMQLSSKKYFPKIPDINNLTNEDYYWIGFIAADGCIHTATRWSNEIELSLAKIDVNHLEKYCDWLNLPAIAIKYYNSNCCRVKFGSKDFRNFLNKLKIFNRKSLSFIPAKKLRYNRHFWRGMVDGDGCLTYAIRCPMLSLCGTNKTCRYFREFVTKKLNLRHREISNLKTKNNKTYNIRYTGNDAISVSQLLYQDCLSFLDRKYNKYLEFNNNV